MKKINLLFFSLCIVVASKGQALTDSVFIKNLYSEELKTGNCFQLLHDLTTLHPHRLSGSQGANDAVYFMEQKMKDFGFDTVWLQECMVPHWERGNTETANIQIAATAMPVKICALGGSIATPDNGITAEIIEAIGLDDVINLGPGKIKGKIVFFNEAFDPSNISTFSSYGHCVEQRWGGAIAAAKFGAIGVVVRSMTSLHDNFPHTGSMGYNDTVPKIPACAISTNDADALSLLLKSNPNLKFYFKLNCVTLPDVKSYNVIGEMRGTEKSNEVIVIGGHLDCWDKGVGAQDDGAGVVQSMEVLSLLKKVGYKPRHTIRAVLFMNEENGGRGGTAYADWAKISGEVHLAAIESDRGGLVPRGFEFSAKDNDIISLKSYQSLFGKYSCAEWYYTGGGGADVGKLKGNCRMIIGFLPDPQRYFDYHHSDNDVFANVNERELKLGAASIAALVYLIDKGF